METGILVLITMFVTLGVYEGMKWLYRQYIYRRNRIVALEVQGKFNANHFSQIRRDIDVIMNKIRELDKLEYRLGKVEGVADNFDRDMNRFNCDIMRDINNRFTEKDKVVDKNQKGLANAFKWIAKLEGFVEANESNFAPIFERIKKLEGNQHDLNSDFVKELAEFSVRIDNMRRSLNDFIGVRQYNADVVDRIKNIEDRQKEYDTNLHTQAVMIGDLQGKANSKGIL